MGERVAILNRTVKFRFTEKIFEQRPGRDKGVSLLELECTRWREQLVQRS